MASKRKLNMKLKILLIAIGFVGFVVLGVNNITAHRQKIQLKEIQLKDTNVQLKQLEQKYDVELKSNDVNEEQLKNLQQEKEELERQLQARNAEKERLAKLSTTQKVYAAEAPSTQATRGNCGDNMYKQYIYQHESGCNTDRWNTSGCYGIGQACPSSKIAHCGADFACQDAWFSNYAIQRYGSWEAAYNFWRVHRWW